MSRVAIVGAGPCGLALLRAFALAREKGLDIPDIVCYEKQSDWGGLWNYSWRIGVDEIGEPAHGSMYRFLWSNGPKECLEFADYTFDEHFKRPIPSFPPREVLQDYIVGRAEKSGIREVIRFNTAVKMITFSDDTGKFSVASRDNEKNSISSEEFDFVAVSTGHFSTPNMPFFEGAETFTGRLMHAHDFRDAEQFTGQDILIVGSSYSAEDIALQCHKYGAKSVTISYRSAAMGFKWPDTMQEVPLLTKLDGKTAHFQNGESRQVDAIILCTGYQHYFPFMEDKLLLQTRNRLYPPNLYKGVLWRDNPKLAYLGMQDQYYTFNMFDAQAWYARDVFMGKASPPAAAEMEKDIAEWTRCEESLQNPFEDIDFQTDYTRDLCAFSDYPPIDLAMIADMFKKWEHDKENSIIGYRNNMFKSPCTGTQAPVHHTAWLEAMDDSMACFFGRR